MNTKILIINLSLLSTCTLLLFFYWIHLFILKNLSSLKLFYVRHMLNFTYGAYNFNRSFPIDINRIYILCRFIIILFLWGVLYIFTIIFILIIICFHALAIIILFMVLASNISFRNLVYAFFFCIWIWLWLCIH